MQYVEYIAKEIAGVILTSSSICNSSIAMFNSVYLASSMVKNFLEYDSLLNATCAALPRKAPLL